MAQLLVPLRPVLIIMPAACVLSHAADAINNAAGFGFSGYDVDGSPQWDMISNLRIMDIEVWLFKMFFNPF